MPELGCAFAYVGSQGVIMARLLLCFSDRTAPNDLKAASGERGGAVQEIRQFETKEAQL
jgi:hypothetical protein